MTKPYRIAVCGTGTAGRAVLREAIRLPGYEVVGAQVYTDAKAGRDIGELVDLPPIGVKTTMDEADIHALDLDCVVYCARDFGDWASDEVLIRYLESGKNVVTSLAYFDPDFREDDVVRRIEEACAKGGSTLHATGVAPGYMGERLTLLLTGLAHDVTEIKVEEIFDISKVDQTMVALFGVGFPVDEAKQVKAAAHIAGIYHRQILGYQAKAIGVKIERIEQDVKFAVTPEDIQNQGYVVKAGTTGAVTHTWTGYVDGAPLLISEATWFAGKSMQPIEADNLEIWRVTIEGRPSVRCFLEVNASMKTGALEYEGDETSPGYYAIGVPIVQAIPRTIEAAPGWLLHPAVGPHWTAQTGTTTALAQV